MHDAALRAVADRRRWIDALLADPNPFGVGEDIDELLMADRGCTDLGTKARTSAAAGVPACCVVDLVADVVHVHLGPSADGWATRRAEPLTAVLEVLGHHLALAELGPPFRPADSGGQEANGAGSYGGAGGGARGGRGRDARPPRHQGR